MKADFNSLRNNFLKGGLLLKDLDPDPFKQTSAWLNEAVATKQPDANAMSLSTVGKSGEPHSRIVLLKEIQDDGIVFYSNYKSDKGYEISQNPRVALLFFWSFMERQLRIEGVVEKLPEEISDLYFASRPRASQLGAWSSAQSSVIENYQILEKAFAEAEKKFKGANVPRPDYWGGYIVKPNKFEFWQGRPSRLHQRFRYNIIGNEWNIESVAP